MAEDSYLSPVEARKKAMDYLARREHGRAELLAKLTRAGFGPDISGTAVEQLIADNLQSDSRFTESFIASRINQGKGPVKIRAELRERGVAAALIDAALRQSGQDWFELAVAVRTRKFGSELPAGYSEKARQMRFLQSRGFDLEQIQAAVSIRRD